MTYDLSPTLFVENGAAILAARAHAARLISREYELLGKARRPVADPAKADAKGE